ncbi:unnamed protein product [Didymodactylos carnosus]|uniref:Uncharacterized protein n=1 Tax=Didymodactylos carnosus TaxID=1234261 RepID=A0A815A3R5_9BILA|nr:unnamed protein product [Didymodactylos carnosus]CAF1251945.1 unnamed protein product [Didymodactylos carnosus]CAF3678484.1 unnamed protein product [Didymodactylos carnosus]CAF4021913.1 unnamed protein product [Didymodactylos carnosus]
MQVASRTNRRDCGHRYITPTMKTTSVENQYNKTLKSRSTNQPQNISTIPIPKQYVSPKKEKTSDRREPTLKKLVDRFRFDEPQGRPERQSVVSDFWWLHDELKNTTYSDTEDDQINERKTDIPEMIEIFPSTDIDQDLNKRASLLLQQTVSAQSDIGNVSSTGLGSTTSTTVSSQPTVIFEQAARPLFTRVPIGETKFGHLDMNDNGDDDILYRWRLRRRLEQAQKGEPITFPTKVPNRSIPSHQQERSYLSIPTTITQQSPPQIPSFPPVATVSDKPSCLKEKCQSEIVIVNKAEASTQTLQDASMQTSPTQKENNSLFTTNLNHSILPSNDLDIHPTRDTTEIQSSSVWHRPPSSRSNFRPQSLPYSVVNMSVQSSSSYSTSPIKNHHQNSSNTFSPVIIHSTPSTSRTVKFIDKPLSKQKLPTVYDVSSSQDSTLTHVTSIVHDNTRNNNTTRQSIGNDIDEDDEIQYIPDEESDGDEFSDDDMLNLLRKKRNDLLIKLREIEQCLAVRR